MIRDILEAYSFDEINDVSNILGFMDFCAAHKYSMELHQLTLFHFFEDTVNGFRDTIFDSNQKSTVTLPPADQVAPLTVIARTLLKKIRQQLNPLLSEEKEEAVRIWSHDIEGWLNLFEVDADLRLNEGTSLLLNTSLIAEYREHRHNKADLYRKGSLLTPIATPLVNLRGKGLFPAEYFFEMVTKFLFP